MKSMLGIVLLLYPLAPPRALLLLSVSRERYNAYNSHQPTVPSVQGQCPNEGDSL